jgi:hypothetical protein
LLALAHRLAVLHENPGNVAAHLRPEFYFLQRHHRTGIGIDAHYSFPGCRLGY